MGAPTTGGTEGRGPARFGLRDGGERTTFDRGKAIREGLDNKPAMEGISPYAKVRLGMLMRKADKKYGTFRNWEKGMPFSYYMGAIDRHLAAYQMHDQAEDHLAAIMWNAMCLMHHEDAGPFDIDDRPVWPVHLQEDSCKQENSGSRFSRIRSLVKAFVSRLSRRRSRGSSSQS